MDPHKHAHTGAPYRSTRTGTSSSNADLPHSSQPSLPSIRQLHPYLPPSGLLQHHPHTGEGSNYIYSNISHFPPPTNPHEQPLLGFRTSSEAQFDSEADEREQSREPPKKKRRRQALSCTECKRRKIKCDRSQPCAPCTRRGEQSRCQWHIVEPIEKYVSRAEFDDLKARYEELYEQVQRLQATSQGPSYFQMGVQPEVPGEAVPTFAGVAYQSMMSPSQAYHPGVESQGHQRYIKPEDIQAPSRHHQSAPATSPAQTRLHASTQPPHTTNKSPTSAAAKTSPYSLASITTPFHPDTQSKNCRAQTLELGQRLRPGLQNPDDLALLPSSGMNPAIRQPQELSRRCSPSRDEDREPLTRYVRDR